MEINKKEIVEAFVQALGREAAENLINRKIKEARLPVKETYDIRELEKLVDELRKEGVLIRTLAMALLSQVRMRNLQYK